MSNPLSSRRRPIRRWSGPMAATLVLGAASLLLAEAAEAQDFDGRWGVREARRWEPLRHGMPEIRGGFTFCRLWYSSVRREPAGLGWSTDYPTGDQNFMIRRSQLTPTRVSQWADGMPGHAVVRATDPDLMRCPFLFASDVGTAGFSSEEVDRLREYFEKGGFLWVDDFWGDRAWEHWSWQIERVLPGHEIVDLGPEHPLFSLVYTLEELPQIPHIQFWRRTGGETSERGAETAEAHLRAIFDESGRLLVLMTHNTDIADGWEREGESDEYFRLFSPPAYALAVNVALWVMTR
jgi:hypothetical protein